MRTKLENLTGKFIFHKKNKKKITEKKYFRKQKLIGKVKFAGFDSVSADKAIVATDENVLAALSSKDGEILWRRVLETENSRGEIKFLHVIKDSTSKGIIREDDNYGIITVSGSNPGLHCEKIRKFILISKFFSSFPRMGCEDWKPGIRVVVDTAD